MSKILRVALSAVVVCSLVPRRPALAQVATTVGPATAWSTSTNYLGIENFSCDCTITGSGNSPRRFIFRSEPMVLGIVPGSASYGILYRGDVITHIDGISILTTEGARRFSSIDSGDDVQLTFKRNGRTMKASIHANESPSNVYVSVPQGGSGYTIAYDIPTPRPPAEPPVAAVPAEPATPSVAPAPRVWGAVTVPRAPRAVYTGVAPVIPATPGVAVTPVVPGVWAATIPGIATSPRGWFGFSIRCNGCGWSSSEPGETPVWESDEAPELSMVARESPAGRAGLRAGDRITHIDGYSLMSREGARKFGAVRPGQRVRLTLKRGNQTLTRELTLASRPEVRAAIAATAPTPPTPRSLRRELRYTGSIDNVSVEVWSPGGPTVEKIGDTMVITTGTSVVRIKVDPKKD
jgi:hypothetical protein